jgi:hypothetical protein
MYPTDDNEEVERTWWTLFPFRGLIITDKRHELRHPLFNDVTFLSIQHVPHVIAALKLEKESRFDFAQTVRHVEQVAEREQAKTFLAVRRRGIVTDNDEEDPPLFYVAKERAYEVSALLAVTFLLHNKYHGTCGLAEQVHTRPENLALVDIDDGAYWVRLTGPVGISPFSAEYDLPIARAQIKKLLFGLHLKPLAEIIISKKSPLPKSLRQAVKQATLRLADALHTPNPSVQLLGAVTAMEILFGIEEGQKYDVYRQRIIALLGATAVERFEIKAIFQARHQYVHEGRDVKDEDVPYQAVRLALACLLHYTQSMATFADKRAFITYLDFVYQAEQLYPHWEVTEQKRFARLLQHKRTPIDLPFGTL